MASLLTPPKFQGTRIVSGFGLDLEVPLVGGKLYAFAAGTSTPKDTYTDSTGTTTNTNPVILDAKGQANVWLGSGAYKLVLTDQNGVVQTGYPVDNVQGYQSVTDAAIATLRADLANGSDPLKGAGQIGFGGMSIYTTGVGKKLQEIRSVKDFGAIADGNFVSGVGTDNTGSFQSAINSLPTGGGGAIFVPRGIYKISSQFTIPDGVTFYGAGKWSSIIFAPSSFANTGGLVRIVGTNGYPTCVRGLGVLGQQGGAGGSGIVSVKNGVFISDVWVSAFTSGNGITLASTENHLADYVSELCLTGVSITEGNCTISNGTNYSCSQGLVLANGPSLEAGRTIVSNVRSPECGASGFVGSGAKHVTFSSCDAAHINNQKFSTAGLFLDSCDDIDVVGFTGVILGTPSTVADGIRVASSTRIRITGGSRSGWRDGINSNASDITITGGSDSSNGRNGRFISGGARVSSSGGDCSNNGLSSTGSGIDSRNSSAFGVHLIVGNICTQQGGGPQAQGIYASLTDNGANNGFTVVEDNVCLFNATANTFLTGKVQNIVTHSNLPEGAVGSVATSTQTAATYTVGVAEEALIANFAGTVTYTLPLASSSVGREIRVKTITNNAAVSANSDVVPLQGGAPGTAILAGIAGRYAVLCSDGTVWQIMAAN